MARETVRLPQKLKHAIIEAYGGVGSENFGMFMYGGSDRRCETYGDIRLSESLSVGKLTVPKMAADVEGGIVVEPDTYVAATDTATDAAMVIESLPGYIYTHHGGYLRKLIGHDNTGIQIGQRVR